MLQAFIVTLREGAEAALIAGIALTYLSKKRPQPSARTRRSRTGKVDGAGPHRDEKQGEPEMPELCVALTDLELREAGTIDHISLPPSEQKLLMRVGFVPGVQVKFSRSAPMGDPSVYSVDGTEIALRAETASHVMVRRGWLSPLSDLP